MTDIETKNLELVQENNNEDLNEDIIRSLHRLNAMSRRGPRHDHPMPPPPPEMADRPTEKKPDPHREHGRGRLMAILNDHGAMPQNRLADMLDIRPQSLSELLGKMEAERLVERMHSGEDKRQIIVSLTEDGLSRVKAFRESHRHHAAEFLAPLTEEEKVILASLLKKLTDAPCGTEKSGEGDRSPVESDSGDEN